MWHIMLKSFPHIEPPTKLFEFAENAQKNGYKVIIAGAGGAAHLPGMIAAKTLVPVLGVPVKSSYVKRC